MTRGTITCIELYMCMYIYKYNLYYIGMYNMEQYFYVYLMSIYYHTSIIIVHIRL